VAPPYDAIVIGSGFGGAVVACRLAEAGARVLVLERGRRWMPAEFPRKPRDAWLFDPRHPQKHNGWLDLRLFRGLAVAQAAGVGGTSLCYSSVVVEAGPELFEGGGWPPEITAAELAPYYARARGMLRAEPIPANQHTQRYKLMQRAAERLGAGARFGSVPLAVSFDPEWSYDLPDPHDPRRARTFVNPQGQRQGTCVHLGNCDIGCDVLAKNTLDLNYIPAAEQRGAEVRPLHLVRTIVPEADGYRVTFDRIQDGRLRRGEERAARIVVAAGSLGTTELLLRCRDQYKSLPGLGPWLGRDWSANGNFFTPDFYRDASKVRQSVGPTISGALDFSDGSIGGQRFLIEDDGFPNLLLNALRAKERADRLSPLAWALAAHLGRRATENGPLGHVMLWLGAGVDSGDGRLSLGRRWLAPWEKELKLAWSSQRSRALIDAIIATERRLSRAGGGKLRVPLYWSLLRSLVTVHPLGGCKMGTSAADGVVDHRGEVFGYRNLYVSDAAILPRPVGRNPSLTIAALAERIAALMTGAVSAG